MQHSSLRVNRVSRLQSVVFWLIPVIILIAGLVFWWRSPRSTPPLAAASTPPTNSAMEAQWGVRITHVGVTADGGLIDMRYLVLDPAKAMTMFESLDTTPKIVATDQTTTLSLRTPHHHKGKIETGRTYYILYRNVQGSVKPHNSVTIVIGDQQLAGFPVE